MKRFAIIVNDTVVNIAIATEPMAENWIDVTHVTPTPEIGWGYQHGTFLPPLAEPTEVIVQKRLITTVALERRFTPDELVRLEIMQLDDPTAAMVDRQIAAALRVVQRKVFNLAVHDLDDSETRTYIQKLAEANLLDSPTRVLTILNSPVLPGEKP